MKKQSTRQCESPAVSESSLSARPGTFVVANNEKETSATIAPQPRQASPEPKGLATVSISLTRRALCPDCAPLGSYLHGIPGMVVKPLDFIAKSRRGLAQPAVKCRGREYLRIIYGPEYTAPQNLERLRSRGLSAKRSLASREFALGIEGLERFVRQEPLRRVHECVFGVLALESEPVDPRL